MLEIKVKNPLAALICSGVVDICDIGVNIGTHPCLVLVNAVSSCPLVMTRFNTIECRHAAEMAFSLGLVTKEQTSQEGVIIGSFFADPIPEGYRSPWAFGCDPATSYLVVNPMFLDEPQNGLKRLSFSEARNGFAPMSPSVTASGEELILPVNKEMFGKAAIGASFTIPMTEEFASLLFSNDRMSQYRKLSLLCKGYCKSFVFEEENGLIFETGQDLKVKTVFSQMLGEQVKLPRFQFHLACNPLPVRKIVRIFVASNLSV